MVFEPLLGRSVLFVVTEDWYFMSHRLPIARAARDAGMKVHVATRVNNHKAAILAEGFELHPLTWRRSDAGLFRSFVAIIELRQLFRHLRPDILHAVAIKSIILCGIASLCLSMRPVFAVTGLGYTYTGKTKKAKLSRAFLKLLFNFVDRRSAVILFQNEDDLRLLRSQGLIKRASIMVVRGSGVDISRFSLLPFSESTVPTLAVVSRMIAIKGIADVVAASRLLQSRGVVHRLMLVGAPDPENPSSISLEQLRLWSRDPDIEWLGHVHEVAELWKHADIAVLASLGGEGLPKSLLEAAACGRPIVATDVAGSRDAVVDEKTGFLVQPGNITAIADALELLIVNPDLRKSFGIEGRGHVQRLFSQQKVVSDTLDIYERVILE